MTAKEVAGVIAGCILMTLAAASHVWFFLGLEMLRRVVFLDMYYINLIQILLPVGIAAGTIIFSISAELVGRKVTLLAIAVPYATAFIIFQFARSISVICIGRVIAGIAVGGSYVVLPVYIGEVASPSSRGSLIALMSVFFFVGTLVYHALAIYTYFTVFNVVAIIFAVIFFILFLILGSESPFYYTRKHKGHHTTESVEVSRNENEVKYIRGTKFMPCYGSTGWIKSMTTMYALVIIQQLSGVNLIPMLVSYLHTYFNYEDMEFPYTTVAMFSIALQILGSLMCTILVDRRGRKFCLMISTLGIGLALIPIAILAAVRDNYKEVKPVPGLTIFFVIAFLIFYTFGVQPVPHILLGELFPFRFKMVAVAFVVCFQQVLSYIIAIYFQDISAFVGYTPILFIFMVSMFLSTGLLYFIVLETKQQSLEDIQLALAN